MKISEFLDPFEQARLEKGIEEINDQNDPVSMVLRLKDLRKCAHNWNTFNSGGAPPGRIVIPSEEKIRDIRQIPVEVDPPMHKSYRALLDPWFKRPLQEAYQEKLTQMIQELIDEAIESDKTEIVEEFSLRLQSRALTFLLNVPYEEADTWISWGTHVFRSEGNALDGNKAAMLDNYIAAQIDQAMENPGEDLYSVLLSAEVNGQKLTREEVHGVINLTFAGGRDTVINAVTNSIAYFAEHPNALKRLHAEPEILNTAVEELVRYFAPLTQLGRVVAKETHICEHAIQAGSRISLCWASANRDAQTFENPNEVMLDRKINPHVSFGFGHHRCLGATHARQILKILFGVLAAKVQSIEVLDYKENIETIDQFKRKVGFDRITVTFNKH